MRKFTGTHRKAIFLSLIGILILAYVGTSLTIGRQVESVITLAQSRYADEPTESLMRLASQEEAPLAERNRAIWALGQLGASEALPVLEPFVTRAACEHDKALCQRELAKAIDLCSGSFNVGAVVWRHGALAAR